MLTSDYSGQKWGMAPVTTKGKRTCVGNASELPWKTDFDSRLLGAILGQQVGKYHAEYRVDKDVFKKVHFGPSEKLEPGLRGAEKLSNIELSTRWLSEHRHEYSGKWVVLDGELLIGASDNPVELVAQARENGVAVPFVTFIEESHKSTWMGWL